MEVTFIKSRKTKSEIVENIWIALIKELGISTLSELLPHFFFLRKEEFASVSDDHESGGFFDPFGHVAIFKENADIGTVAHELMHHLFNLLVPINVKWKEYEYIRKGIEFPYLRFLNESLAYLVDGYYSISLLDFLPPIQYPKLEDIVKKYFNDLIMKNIYDIGSYISYLAMDAPSYLVWYLIALGRGREVFNIARKILDEIREIKRPEDARNIYKKYIESKLEEVIKEFYLTKYEIAFEYIRWLIERGDYKIAKVKLAEIEQWYLNNKDKRVRKVYQEKIKPLVESLKRQILYGLKTEKAKI